MNLNDLLFMRKQMERGQQPDATLGSNGTFMPRQAAAGAMPQFADPRVQAMLPPVPGPARYVGPAPGSSPVQGPLPMQGPPMPAAWNVPGYAKGLAEAGPGAQAYADQFAGGDLSKIRSRLINIDGEMKNDYYMRGLLDGPMPTASDAPQTPQPGLFDRFGNWIGGFFGG